MRGLDFWQVEIWEQVMAFEKGTRTSPIDSIGAQIATLQERNGNKGEHPMLLPDIFQLEVERLGHGSYSCRGINTPLVDVPPSKERSPESAIARFLLTADRMMQTKSADTERIVPRYDPADRPPPHTEEGRAWNEAAAKLRIKQAGPYLTNDAEREVSRILSPLGNFEEQRKAEAQQFNPRDPDAADPGDGGTKGKASNIIECKVKSETDSPWIKEVEFKVVEPVTESNPD